MTDRDDRKEEEARSEEARSEEGAEAQADRSDEQKAETAEGSEEESAAAGESKDEAAAEESPETTDSADVASAKGEDERDEKEGESTAAARSKSSASKTKRGRGGRQAKGRSASKTQRERNGTSALGMWILVAVIVGVAGGWIARDARAHTMLTGKDGGNEACRSWQEKICGEVGDSAFACNEAKSASSILPPEACHEAMDAVPSTVAKIKKERAVCDNLVSKLCKDIGEETDTCKMVQDKTAAFPTDRCDQMMEQYDQVVAQLQMLEQKRGGMGAHGGPPGQGGPVRAAPSQPGSGSKGPPSGPSVQRVQPSSPSEPTKPAD